MKKGKGSSSQQQEDAKPPISIKRFAVTYIVLMGTFFALISFTPLQKIIDLNGLYSRMIVIITSAVLSVLGMPVTHSGTLIHLPTVTLDVVFGCNGLDAAMIFAIAVIAYPAPWKKKLIGIAGGFAVLQVINIIRIVILAYLANSGVHLTQYFEYIHLYVAQGMMIAISLGIFFLYLNYAKTSQAAHQ
jgi:exosortase H (IPTLxxWG-CTERM-specific)